MQRLLQLLHTHWNVAPRGQERLFSRSCATGFHVHALQAHCKSHAAEALTGCRKFAPLCTRTRARTRRHAAGMHTYMDPEHCSLHAPSSASLRQLDRLIRAPFPVWLCIPPPQQNHSLLHSLCDKHCTGEFVKPAFLYFRGAGSMRICSMIRRPAAFLAADCSDIVHFNTNIRALSTF